MTDTPPKVDFDAVKARVNATAMEAITQLFHSLPWGTKIPLSNGKTMVLTKFVEPRISHRDMPGWQHEGSVEFGFDLKAEDGSSHIEIYAFQTGWGGAP